MENSLWNLFYRRRDLDHVRYAAYLAAEEELEERSDFLLLSLMQQCASVRTSGTYLPQKLNLIDLNRFYAESCYYLDNLCVDFRYQRKGIGALLLDWGIKHARNQRLPIQTEASPMGVGLYLKNNFKRIGVWELTVLEMSLPVMKLADP